MIDVSRADVGVKNPRVNVVNAPKAELSSMIDISGQLIACIPVKGLNAIDVDILQNRPKLASAFPGS